MALARDARYVVLLLFVLAANPRPAILVYLRRRRRANDSELLYSAEEALLSASDEELQELLSNEQARPAQRRVAKRLLAEQTLFEWCRTVNESRGVAPSTAALLRHARKCEEDLPASVFNVNASGKIGLPARVWANGWRKRWNVKLGTIQSTDAPSREELVLKVRL